MARRRSSKPVRTSTRVSASSTGALRTTASTRVRVPGGTMTWTLSTQPGRLPRLSVSTRTSSSR